MFTPIATYKYKQVCTGGCSLPSASTGGHWQPSSLALVTLELWQTGGGRRLFQPLAGWPLLPLWPTYPSSGCQVAFWSSVSKALGLLRSSAQKGKANNTALFRSLPVVFLTRTAGKGTSGPALRSALCSRLTNSPSVRE